MCCDKAKEIVGGGDHCYTNSHTASENASRFELIVRDKNTFSFCRIKYDGCAYMGMDKRCDYVFTVCKHNDADNYETIEWIFVELKGQEIETAIEQLAASIRRIGMQRLQGNKAAVVVSSRVPKGGNSKINKAKEAFVKEFGITPIIKNRQHNYIVKFP